MIGGTTRDLPSMSYPPHVVHMVGELTRGLPRCEDLFDTVADTVGEALLLATGSKTFTMNGRQVAVTRSTVSNILALHSIYTTSFSDITFTGAAASCRIAVACPRVHCCSACGSRDIKRPAKCKTWKTSFYHMDGYSCIGLVLYVKCEACETTMWPSFFIMKAANGVAEKRVPYIGGEADPNFFMPTMRTAIEVDLLNRLDQEM